MAKSKVIKLGDRNNPEIEKVVELLVGASGTQFFTGFFNISDADEYVQDLKGIRALETFNRMRRGDGQVKLALLALTHPIVNAQWKIQPAGDPEKDDPSTPQEEEAAKYISQWIFDDSFQWEQFLRQALSFFWAGFSLFEKLYVYDGKFIKPKKLSQRLQTTIVEWDVKEEELIQVRQYIPAGKTARQVWIPAQKLVMFVYDREGDDFRGQSALRAAYKHWFYKDTFYRIQGMQIERWALGVPKISQTDSIVSNPNKTKAIDMAKNLRAHEKGYAFVPKGFELELLDSGTAKMIEPQGAIDHHNKSILKAIMAQFLELGIDDTGSRAVGKELKDFYLMGLSFAANYVCEVLKNQMFKELTEWNFGQGVRPPRLVFEGIQPMDLELLSRSYSQLVTSGSVTMDDPTEAYIRKQVGMPKQDQTTARKKVDPLQGDPTENQTEDPDAKKSKVKATSEKGTAASYSESYTSQGMEADTWIHLWRPLRPTEECLALREIVGRLDDTKERLVKITKRARASVLDEIIEQANQAVLSKNPVAAQKIDYSESVRKELVSEVAPLLKEILEYGYDQVLKELGRQRTTMASIEDLSDAEIAVILKKYLKAQTDQFSEKTLDILVDRLRIAASNAIRSGEWNIDEIRKDIETISENTIRRFGGGLLSDAFGIGRREAAEDKKEEIDYAEYSAILDNNTCFPCSELDGEEFDLGSTDYLRNSPPLPQCDSVASGYNMCRCIWVYVSKEEKAPQA